MGQANPCPICHTRLLPLNPPADERAYRSCPNCQWITLDKSWVPSLEKQKERYLQHENSLGNPGYVEMFEGFIKACVEPFVSKGGKILDYGCGPEPVLADLLTKRGHAVDIYDLFFNPDETHKTKKYNLIILAEVLEHLENPLVELRTLSERLEPQGVISIMTLFHPNDPETFFKWWYRRDITHVSFYTLKTLQEIVRVLGMDLIFSDSERTAVMMFKGSD
jgi:hypothetical protein